MSIASRSIQFRYYSHHKSRNQCLQPQRYHAVFQATPSIPPHSSPYTTEHGPSSFAHRSRNPLPLLISLRHIRHHKTCHTHLISSRAVLNTISPPNIHSHPKPLPTPHPYHILVHSTPPHIHPPFIHPSPISLSTAPEKKGNHIPGGKLCFNLSAFSASLSTSV